MSILTPQWRMMSNFKTYLRTWAFSSPGPFNTFCTKRRVSCCWIGWKDFRLLGLPKSLWNIFRNCWKRSPYCMKMKLSPQPTRSPAIVRWGRSELTALFFWRTSTAAFAELRMTIRFPNTLIELISPGSRGKWSAAVGIDKDDLAYHTASPTLRRWAILSLRACLGGYRGAVMV